MRKCLLFTFLVVHNLLQSQSPVELSDLSRIGEVLPPSPNAASLGSYGGLPNTNSSGAISLSIPLFSIETPNLSIPVSANYYSTGFKVDEVSSRLGNSWNLDIGGVITRTVMDAPDELSTDARSLIPTGFHSQTSNEDIYDFLKIVNQNSFDFVDMQPDIFSFNFGNYSGKFILHNNSIFPLEHTNLHFRASFIESGLIEGYSFKITAPDGVSYFFGGVNEIEISSSSSTGPECSGNKDFEPSPTAWYLGKIVHPDGDFIEFSYSSVDQTYKYSISQSQSRKILNSDFYGCVSDPLSNGTNSTCIMLLQSYGVRLDEITTSSGQKIEIDYSVRSDLEDDFLFDKIVLYHSNNVDVLRVFDFEYLEITSTSFGNTFGVTYPDLLKRYFLSDIIERNVIPGPNDKKYSFEYNSLGELPQRLSYSQDYWGYFNGKVNSTLVYSILPILNGISLPFTSTANRNPDYNYSKKGVLSKIIYPTGGWDEIFYENNSIKVTELQKTDIQNYNINNNGISYSFGSPEIKESSVFTPNQDQNINFNITCTYFGEDDYEPEYDRVVYSILNVTDNIYLFNEATLFAGDGIVNNSTIAISLIAGKSYKTIIKIYGKDVSATSSVTYQNFSYQNVTFNKEVGGIRKYRVNTYDSQTEIHLEKYYYYSFIETPEYSSADNIVFNFENLSISKLRSLCDQGTYPCDYVEAFYYNLSSSPNYNISKFSGHHISYKSVLESSGEAFINGGKEFIYSSSLDEPPTLKYGDATMLSPFSNRGWHNGLLLQERDFAYDGTNFIFLQKKSIDYIVDSRVIDDIKGYTIRENYLTPCFLGSELNLSDLYDIYPFDVYEYDVRRRWVYPVKETNITYSQEGVEELIKIFNFEHEAIINIHPTKIISNNSREENVSLITTYSGDLFESTQPLWLNYLEENNVLELPVEQLIIREKNDLEYVISGQLIEYHEDFLKPGKVYKLELSAPVLLSEFNKVKINAGVLEFDSNYELITQLDYFTPFGNLKEKSDFESLQKQSFLWDYNNTYLIAHINNAEYADFAYTSFETNNFGNWNVPGGSIADISAPTGDRVYELNGSNNITKSISSSTEYVLSYWIKSTTPLSISGSVSGYPKIRETIGDWTNFEHLIYGINTVTISGISRIDELRLIPSISEIQTYTYKPFVGIINQSDKNNRITYYEYDNMGRLKLIKDSYKNIIKHFDYKFKSPLLP